jgi:hypothetical protein
MSQCLLHAFNMPLTAHTMCCSEFSWLCRSATDGSSMVLHNEYGDSPKMLLPVFAGCTIVQGEMCVQPPACWFTSCWLCLHAQPPCSC